MKTVIWNRHLIDGSIQEVSFTALFSENSESIDAYLEEMAHRQGVLRNRTTFMDEMSKVSLAYEIDLILATSRDDVIKASEYYTAKAMILTVRYSLSEERGAQDIALESFKYFMTKVHFNPLSEYRIAS